MALLKLTASNLVTRKARVALTVLAIAFSVSLVVSVTSGYKSIEGAAFKFLNQFLGSVDAQVSFAGQGTGFLPESLVGELRKDPAVRGAVGRLESDVSLVPHRRAEVKGIRRPDDREVEKLGIENNQGAWFDTSTGDVCVIDQVLASLLHLHVGETLELPGVAGRLPLKVVGIIHKPEFLAHRMQSVYVPIETLQKFVSPDNPHVVTDILVSFHSGTDGEAFARRWRPRLEAINPQIKLTLSKDRRQDMAKKLEGLGVLSMMAGAVSMLAATFIVFSTLSMGVSERQRTLAMLRAIGAFRSQLGILVVGEGLLLASAGVAIGVPLGWLWVRLLVHKYHTIFTAGVVVDWRGVIFATAGSLLAALAASFIPAFQAMRTSPLEAMTPLASPTAGRLPWRSAVAGVCLALVDPLLVLRATDLLAPLLHADTHGQLIRSIKFYGHFLLGLPATMTGFFLLAPLFVYGLDRLLSPLIAPMLGLRLALVRQQLSTGVWRAAGTCAALMVGLSVLVVMETEGHSMIQGWQLPTKFPDVFIVSPLIPVSDENAAKVARIKGIKELMPLPVASPTFGTTGMFALMGATVVPDATMFFGVDPDKAFDLMSLDFREGNPADAKAMLKKGRHIIVTEEFRQLKGLHVGDTVSLKTTSGPVDYTIAGVVTSPGLDVIVGLYDLGKQFNQSTAASIFGTIADAKRDFGVTGATFLAANLEVGFKREALNDRIRSMGLIAYDVRQIKYGIQKGLSNLLTLVAVVPLAALAVASLGVTNTILASIRTRAWQFGVLRSIGVTRSQLLRLVAAEAILLGLVGIALGLVAGAELTFNVRTVNAVAIGYVPPVRVPWRMIETGIAAVMLVAILASVFPALGVARKSPLALLQAGRSAA